MMSTSSLRSPLRVLLPVAASLWLGTLGLAVWASARIAKLSEKTRINHEAMRSLDPDMNQLDTYQKIVRTLLETDKSAPELREWMQAQNLSLPTSSHKEQTSTLEHSHLRVRTATATWEAIDASQFQTIVETARNAPASYRLCEITLSPATHATKLKIEATFRAFTQ